MGLSRRGEGKTGVPVSCGIRSTSRLRFFSAGGLLGERQRVIAGA
jgi:hypothetical protein